MIYACTTLGFVCVFSFFLGVLLYFRVTEGACPVTTDFIIRDNVRTTTTTTTTRRTRRIQSWKNQVEKGRFRLTESDCERIGLRERKHLSLGLVASEHCQLTLWLLLSKKQRLAEWYFWSVRLLLNSWVGLPYHTPDNSLLNMPIESQKIGVLLIDTYWHVR